MTIKTLQPGVLTVAVDYGFGLPFAENSNSGSDIQYIRSFAQENGLRINFVEQPSYDDYVATDHATRILTQEWKSKKVL